MKMDKTLGSVNLFTIFFNLFFVLNNKKNKKNTKNLYIFLLF